MLHAETLEAYRHMTPSERLTITLDMIRANTPHLFTGTQEQIERKFELLRRQNDERTRNMLEGMGRARAAG